MTGRHGCMPVSQSKPVHCCSHHTQQHAPLACPSSYYTPPWAHSPTFYEHSLDQACIQIFLLLSCSIILISSRSSR